ncbi:MAG: SRPBCC domain-containing protein, partial [Gammaproteobacteria bacterium]|nr:SRPBCC domain-containing protein [Gammaproteobacteria bacterium]
MAQIKHRVGIRGSAGEIYQLLTTDAGLSKWWTSETRGAGDVGSIIAFRFGGGGPDFEVVELIVDRKVVWQHSGEMPPGWIGSEISFELEETEEQTFVNFSHHN